MEVRLTQEEYEKLVRVRDKFVAALESDYILVDSRYYDEWYMSKKTMPEAVKALVDIAAKYKEADEKLLRARSKILGLVEKRKIFTTKNSLLRAVLGILQD
jgi:hypothetical protein